MTKNIQAILHSYARDLAGTVLVAFALMAPVIVGSVGMAMDYAQAYLVQQRLAQALDSAALAGAASSADEDEIEAKIKQFFDANYPEDKLGATFDPEVEVVGNEVHVTGHAIYNTFFLNVVGVDQIDVAAQTTVQRLVQGIEVALVLDNTGSMATNNNIGALKEAARNFINILFDNTDNANGVRIALVPYSNSVRVGNYGLGKKPDGSSYDGDAFVSLPGDMSYTTDHSSANWYGCIIEHKSAGYTGAATAATNAKGQLWKSGTSWSGHGWDPSKTTNDPYPEDVSDDYEGPWDVYSYGRIISKDQKCSDYTGYATARCSSCSTSTNKCTTNYCFCWPADTDEGTNSGCPFANVQPLTSDRDLLLSQVEPDDVETYNLYDRRGRVIGTATRDGPIEPDDMEPHGSTLSNIGMLWGYRVLSPEAPFEEAHDWDDIYWQKYVVLMTDGDNTEDATYSTFWATAKNSMSVTKFNERLEETCKAMKEKGITIYTITFTSGINDTTKGYYRRCASSENKYFDAPDQADLIDVFERISREISSLHIKE